MTKLSRVRLAAFLLSGMLVSGHSVAAENNLPANTELPQVYYPDGEAGLQVGSEDFLRNHSSLAGLDGVYVLLDYVFGTSENNGIALRSDDLEEQVRQRLESAGLRMLTKEEMTVTPGLPEMAIFPSYTGGSIGENATPLNGATDSNSSCLNQCCRNSIWASFSQSASILRRPDTQYKLSTWGNGDDSNWCENRGEWMYDAVLGVVDLFVDDYKKARSEDMPVTIASAKEVPNDCSQTWSMHLELFDTGSAELKQPTTPILDQLALQAQRCGNYRYEIETHADKRATESYNKILTQARASVIKTYLVNSGIGYERITTLALGESQPINHGNSESDHAENRRVVIRPILDESLMSMNEE